MRGYIVRPESIAIEKAKDFDDIKIIDDSAGAGHRNAFVYEYFDYAQNETRHNVVRLRGETLENVNMVEDFYKEPWLKAKQLSNDLVDMFLIRENNETAFYFVNDFEKYGPYGASSGQHDLDPTLFGVHLRACPYKYMEEGGKCELDIDMDRYAKDESSVENEASFSFEGMPQLRKKNHQFVKAGSRSELVRGCLRGQYGTLD